MAEKTFQVGDQVIASLFNFVKTGTITEHDRHFLSYVVAYDEPIILDSGMKLRCGWFATKELELVQEVIDG